jgi:gluconate kinase
MAGLGSVSLSLCVVHLCWLRGGNCCGIPGLWAPPIARPCAPCSTVGRALSDALGWSFLDADDFHPASSIDKMRHGVPLTDDDRWPWLLQLHAALRAHVCKCSSSDRRLGLVQASAPTSSAGLHDSPTADPQSVPLPGGAVPCTLTSAPAPTAAVPGRVCPAAASAHVRQGSSHGVVLACSALKVAYRCVLRCGRLPLPGARCGPARHGGALAAPAGDDGRRPGQAPAAMPGEGALGMGAQSASGGEAPVLGGCGVQPPPSYEAESTACLRVAFVSVLLVGWPLARAACPQTSMCAIC